MRTIRTTSSLSWPVLWLLPAFRAREEPHSSGEGPLAGIKWVLKNPAIGTTVPFMQTIPELEMNFRAMSEPYTPEDEKMIFVRNEQIRPLYCRMCYQCKGQCPKGLQITDELRFLTLQGFSLTTIWLDDPIALPTISPRLEYADRRAASDRRHAGACAWEAGDQTSAMAPF